MSVSKMFSLKILTEIANRIIPKTLRNTIKPPGPIFFSRKFVDLSTANMMNRFKMIPIKILAGSYTARNESMVVSVPAPAISGNAKGTIEPIPFEVGSDLKSVMPKIISTAIKNIMIAPAIANEC